MLASEDTQREVLDASRSVLRTTLAQGADQSTGQN
jgi:hypothetical protein